MSSPAVHLFSALPAAASAGQVPDWVHLVPAGTFAGVDGRGPYTLADPEKVIAASITGGKLPIDENHAIDLAAPHGGPSPARGWIVELQNRADGLWGRVEWTDAGRQLLADRAYRGFSPAFIPDSTGRVVRLLRASLVNDPNLKSLATLHQHQKEVSMDLLAQLRQLLGLAEDADEAAVVAAVKALQGAEPALQARIAKAVGLQEGAETAVVLNAVTTLAQGAGAQSQAIVQLQSELASVTTQLNTIRSDRATERATAFVDGEIKRGRVGVKPLRDHYIAMHAVDPARVEKEIGALPILGPSGAAVEPPRHDQDGKPVLNAAQLAAATVLGIAPDDYAQTLAAEQAAQQETA